MDLKKIFNPLINNFDTILNFEDCLISPNGYVKFPNGLILQWGKYEKETYFSSGEIITISFPITFPNEVFSFSGIVSPGHNNSITFHFACTINQDLSTSLPKITNSSVELIVWDENDNTPTQGKGYLWWIAIGY